MKKINTTKNYSLFSISQTNRPIDIRRHRKLKESMQEYGFLEEFPIVCVRDDKKNLVIWDGQHRYTIAQLLGLPIHYVESSSEFDIAKINSGQLPWTPSDYAESFAIQGNKEYSELIDFCRDHRVSIGRGAALLSGNTTFNNIQSKFFDGKFKVTDRELANSVAKTYRCIIEVNSSCSSSRLIEGLMGVHRVSELNVDQLMSKIRKNPDLVKQHGTRDSYLEMLEQIYNFHARNALPLKFLSEKELRSRNPTVAKTKKTSVVAE